MSDPEQKSGDVEVKADAPTGAPTDASTDAPAEKKKSRNKRRQENKRKALEEEERKQKEQELFWEEQHKEAARLAEEAAKEAKNKPAPVKKSFKKIDFDYLPRTPAVQKVIFPAITGQKAYEKALLLTLVDRGFDVKEVLKATALFDEYLNKLLDEDKKLGSKPSPVERLGAIQEVAPAIRA
ncbi:hypothetical protein BJ508DRAFT_356928 [Ascobolus immersus RN42]|uniref:Uncharacterized protein n=1 Tax=Ascobolus immersus RN42 TaxID=1160509 RepID=A0A3N4IR42_ASCIM|nr:hypothetical protein BJ508DRAFT_356928 [Ascobolus immersus RN42]